MANIKPDREHDPFPRAGLVKNYEAFIRKEIGAYCKKYPHVPWQDMLIEGVRLAVMAEGKFKPGFRNANDFSTYMRHWLKGLNRFAEAYSGEQKVRAYEDPEYKAQREAAERGEDPRAIDYRGGNATRLTFDWQWTLLDAWQLVKKRSRIVFGFQAHTAAGAIALSDRLQELRSVLGGRRPDAWLAGVSAAFLDHMFRRQREADSEAEKRAAGDHSPTFLEADRVADVQFVGAKEPPGFAPEYVPMMRLDEHSSFDDAGNRMVHHELAAAKQPPPPLPSDEEAIAAIERERPFLSLDENIAADAAIEAIRGAPYSASVLAAKLGMTKGGASKVFHRVIDKVAARRK